MNAQPAVPSRDEQRQQLIARIERDRTAVHETLKQLARPVRELEHWKQKAGTLWPVLPSLLVGGGVLYTVIRLLRGSRTPRPGTRRSGWGGWIERVLIAWRLAIQVQALLGAARRVPQPNAASRLPTAVTAARSSESRFHPSASSAP